MKAEKCKKCPYYLADDDYCEYWAEDQPSGCTMGDQPTEEDDSKPIDYLDVNNSYRINPNHYGN